MKHKRGRSAILLSSLISKIQLCVGVLTAGLFGLAGFGVILESRLDVFTAVVVVLMLLLAAWLFWCSAKRSRLIKRFKQYAAALSTDPLHSLDNLALVLNASVDQVRTDVEQMVRLGFFASAYINQETNCLVLAGANQGTGLTPPESGPAPGSTEQATVLRTVICSGCGARNAVAVGGAAVCEYCSSPLNS